MGVSYPTRVVFKNATPTPFGVGVAFLKRKKINALLERLIYVFDFVIYRLIYVLKD